MEGKYWVLMIVVMLVIGGVAYSIGSNGIDQDDVDKVNKTAYQEGVDSVVPEVVTETEVSNETSVPAEELESVSGYLIDGLFLETSIDDELSNRELNLFDGDIEFDGEEYGAEEVLTLSGLLFKANEEDMEGVPFLSIVEGAISYVYVIEDDLNTSEINEDETLKINFLGGEVEISEWDVDEITFTSGETHFISSEEEKIIEGRSVILLQVYSGKISISVEGERRMIEEGETAKLGGLEIFVKDVSYQPWFDGYQEAELVIGSDVEVSVSNGDEYEEDSIWEYVIDANSIGLILKEEFTELDEDFNALATEEKICLPNDYVCVVFDGLLEEDYNDYAFEIENEGRLEYVQVTGDFQKDLEDYEEILINATGIYDEDLEEIGTSIELADTENLLVLNISTGEIVIEDFRINLDLNVSQVYDGSSWNIIDDEKNYLTDFGILIENPEDAVDDLEWSIVVPEEKVEGSITVL